ncbi:MAG: cation:proton antiporter [Methanomicrobiales archaeon]|nr:cation:proton antiporter [Methanomicrobiales archaeon]
MSFGMWDLALLFLCAKAGGMACSRLRQPPLVGELLGGAVLGAVVSGLAASETIRVVSQIGIMFLILLTMLSIDLDTIEGNLERLILSQVCTAAVIFLLLALLFAHLGLDPGLVPVVGAAIFGSSTVIAVRFLFALGRLNSPEGRTIIGFQVMNGIVEILLIASVVNLLQAREFSAAPLLSLGLMVAGTFAVASRLGERFVQRMMASVQALRLDEVLLALTLLLAFSLAAITEAIGLTPYLGVMLAGILVSRTPQAGAVSRSIRQIGEGFFIPVFFASLGLGVTVLPLLLNLPWLVFLLAVFAAIRFAAAMVPALFCGHSLGQSVRVAAGMAPMSEYGLLMLGLGAAGGVLDGTFYSVLVGVFLLGNLLSPLLISASFSGGRSPHRKPGRHGSRI